MANQTTPAIQVRDSNVGIGTTTPYTKLSVVRDITTTAEFGSFGQFALHGATDLNKILSFGFNTSDNVGFIQPMINGTSYNNLLLNARGGNVLIGTTTDAGYKLSVAGDILASAASGNRSVVLTTNNANAALNVIAGAGAELATDGTNQNISFRTGAASRMYITSGGNVGIGTGTTAYTRLQIQEGGNARALIQTIGTEAAGDNAGLYFKSAIHYTDAYIKGALIFRNAGVGNGIGDLILATNNTANSVNVSTDDARLWVKANGNILIGTGTDAGYKLDVNGKTNVSGGTITAGSETTYAFRVLQGKPITLGGDDNYAYIQSWSSGPLVLNSQGNDVLISNSTSRLSVGTASLYTGMGTRLFVGHPQNSTVVNENQFISVGVAGGSTNQAGINFLVYNAQYGGRIYTDDNAVRGLAFDVLQVGTFYNAMNITRTTSPNVLIGTTTDNGYKLSVNGSGYFNGIGFFENRVASNNSFSDANNVRVLKPLGGSRNSITPVETGAIKITYPVGYTNTMHRVKFNIYNYQENQAYTVYFGGYNYGPGPYWVNTFAYTITPSGTDFNPTVRFGYDGTYMVVYIGELNWTWSYPQFFIEEVEIGFNLASQFATDTWSIGLEASAFQNVTATRSNTQSTNWARNGSVTYNTFGNVGIGTTSPTMYGGNGMEVASSGQTGIRVSSSTTGKVEIGADSTGGYIQTALAGNVLSFYTGEANPLVMRMTSTGNVLIGTTTDAGYKLDVNGSGRFSGLLQVNGPGSVARADSHGISLFNGNVDYRISFDSQSGTKGFIRYNVDTAGSSSHGHIFSAGDFSGGSLTDLMLVRADGNVGIGTTSPSTKLTIDNSANANTNHIDMVGYNSTAKGHLGQFSNNLYLSTNYFYEGGQYNDTSALGQAAIALVAGATSTSFIDFNLSDAGANNPSNKVRINANGNVLIGTTTDNGARLRVDGGPVYFDNGASNTSIVNSNDYSLQVTQSLATNASTFSESLFLLNSNQNDNNFVAIGMSTNGTDGQHHRVSLRALRDGNVGGQFQMALREAGTSNNVVRLTVKSNGNVLIGTTTDSGYKLDVVGDTRITSGSLGVGVAPNATDGRIDASNDIVAYQTSDQRLKENVTPIENALDKVKALTGVEFDWIEEHKHIHGYEGHDTGIIAQQVQAVMPTAVRTNDSGYLSVRYEKMIALLIEGMKEQQKEIDELKKLIK
jgi:hypothetical protein